MRSMRNALWIATLCIATAGLAFAGGANKSLKVEFLEKMIWNGVQLAPGKYEIAWDGDGGDVKVTLRQGNKVVTEGRGRIEQRAKAAPDTGVVSHPDGSGAGLLIEVRFAKQNKVLVLAGS